MADFLSDLWQSIFTPGPTTTLLVATNVTFGALQLLLVALLAATYSIHFAILSVLCGGLWASINWFAREMKALQAKEEEEQAAEKSRKRQKAERSGEGVVEDSADDEGDDTEVEDGTALKESTSSLSPGSGETFAEVLKDGLQGDRSSMRETTTGVEVSDKASGASESRLRRQHDADRSGEVSTDSEWEKISQDSDR